MSVLSKPGRPTAITYAEILDPGKAGLVYTADHVWEMKRSYLVAYADRWKFCRELLGGSEVDELNLLNGVPYKTKRDLPVTYPVKLINNQAPAAGFVPLGARRIAPHGTCLVNGVYQKAQIETVFGLVKYDLGQEQNASVDESNGSRFVETSFETKVEDARTPPQYFQWEQLDAQGQLELGQKVFHPLKFFLPRGLFTLTWHLAPRAPVEAIAARLGSLNDDTFFGWERGRLLLSSAILSRQRWFQGEFLYTCTYMFVVQGLGYTVPKTQSQGLNGPFDDYRVAGNYTHNHFVRYGWSAAGAPLGKQILLMTHDGTAQGKGVFSFQDFKWLLRPGPAHTRF